jgi:hypothetical protein
MLMLNFGASRVCESNSTWKPRPTAERHTSYPAADNKSGAVEAAHADHETRVTTHISILNYICYTEILLHMSAGMISIFWEHMHAFHYLSTISYSGPD